MTRRVIRRWWPNVPISAYEGRDLCYAGIGDSATKNRPDIQIRFTVGVLSAAATTCWTCDFKPVCSASRSAACPAMALLGDERVVFGVLFIVACSQSRNVGLEVDSETRAS